MSDLAAQEQNRGYQWWLQVKNAEVVARHIPLEAMLSFPVGSAGELRLFHYQIRGGKVLRPLTYIRVAVPSIIIREFTMAKQRPIFTAVSQVDAGDHDGSWDKKLQIEALNLVPLLMSRYPAQPAGALGEQYWEVVRQLSPSGLLPFYEALNPEFVHWLTNSA